MSYQETPSQLNPLPQIPLTRNPFIQFPQAVTLPYTYATLPPLSALPSIPDLSPAPSPSLTQGSIALQEKIESSKQTWEAWKLDVANRKMKQARRLAPGFLDTGVTLLTPTAVQKLVSEDHVAQDKKEEQEEEYSNQFASLRFR